MSNDLISRRRLIDALEDYEKYPIADDYNLGIAKAKLIAEGQPTAYDVDMVAEELILKSLHQSNNASIIGTKDAIDIVKRGGIE